MKVRGGFEQSYNAQATVEVTTMLIVSTHFTDQANDKQQLIPTLSKQLYRLRRQTSARTPAIRKRIQALAARGRTGNPNT